MFYTWDDASKPRQFFAFVDSSQKARQVEITTVLVLPFGINYFYKFQFVFFVFGKLSTNANQTNAILRRQLLNFDVYIFYL